MAAWFDFWRFYGFITLNAENPASQLPAILAQPPFFNSRLFFYGGILFLFCGMGDLSREASCSILPRNSLFFRCCIDLSAGGILHGTPFALLRLARAGQRTLR
jgi:hypothetical protein